MQSETAETDPHDHAPLISTRFLVVATCLVFFLAIASVAISYAGRIYGEQLSLAGHSGSREILTITIGRDQLSLPTNTIRFEQQRVSGPAEQIDLYLLWPEMTGYDKGLRRRFDDLAQEKSLIFLQISQSTMSRDMSGRVGAIYAHLLESRSEPGPAGLTLKRFERGAGYDGEALLTASRVGDDDYAVRCLLPAKASQATDGDCQRDIHVGDDLTVMYRFSSRRLGDWAKIDQAVRSYVGTRATPAPSDSSHKMRPITSTKSSS
ncbi:hypothetical protein [Rhizobium sp. 18065]|uniref:hypothetical protein n=1 Tax=Rhizobium sp. 18065 TaxID=2681411 RepID=UPI00135CF478|nr:hypothetical protein [Rhizobium sp. 18065]